MGLKGPGSKDTSSGRRGRLIGSLGYIWAVLGRGTGPRGEEMAGGFTGTDSQDLATILDPFRLIFDDLGPDETSETSTSVLSQQQTSVLSQQQPSVLSEQQASVLSQQQASVLSQQKTSILSQQKTGQLPASGRLL